MVNMSNHIYVHICDRAYFNHTHKASYEDHVVAGERIGKRDHYFIMSLTAIDIIIFIF